MFSADDFARFVKLAGMLGSEYEGERASAAKLASDLLRQHELTWRDVLRQPAPPAPATPTGWQTSQGNPYSQQYAQQAAYAYASMTEEQRQAMYRAQQTQADMLRRHQEQMMRNMQNMQNAR